MTTIRDALANAQPHVSLKQAWKAVIQQSRAQRKEGLTRALFSRARVDRFLQQPLPAEKDIGLLKSALRDVLTQTDHATLVQALTEIDAWVEELVEACPNDCLVTLSISLDPSTINDAEIDRWLGTSQGRIELRAIEASRWLHHLNGRIVAGVPLTVRASYNDSRPLPQVARKDRSRVRSVGQKGWLPHLDDVGRFSASPLSIAQSHAREFHGCSMVIDPFCGAGGDAIAVAMSGPTVVASDISLDRLKLARANADHFGVSDRIRFQASDAANAIASALEQHQNLGLYLDPPWGGTDWDQSTMSSTTLFRMLPNLNTVLSGFKVVVLKLPRTFPVEQLGSFGGPWEFRFGLDTNMADPVDQLKTLFAVRHPTG